LAALATTKAELIVPILNAGRDLVLGTIDLESESLNAFDAATEALLEKCTALLEGFSERSG